MRSGLFFIILSSFLHPHSLRGQHLNVNWLQHIPEVSSFSSPRTADLNGDGIEDIVIGAGIEQQPSVAGIFAFDGLSGNILWQRYARDQVYGSPIFQDLNHDSIPEVFISGRDAQLYALDGQNGGLIWEFWPDNLSPALDSGWYNFYLPQWIPDQNGDSILDLIVTNGGDPSIAASVKDRPPGYLLAISGLDGSILQSDTMPDGEETYHSPLVVDFLQNGDLQLLFGSGGESVGGSYWQVGLADFMNHGLFQAQALLSQPEEGFIAVPSIADLNQDGIPDLVVPQLHENIIALDGSNGQELWRHTETGADCYVSPSLGQFTGDPTPDVFVIASVGNWPFYQQSIKLLLDGSNGQLVWSEFGYPFQMTSGNAIDWDNDGYDEIIYPVNQDTASTGRFLRHQFHLYDFNDQSIIAIDSIRDGLIVFSMPLIRDLEGDQQLEFIFATHDNTGDWYQPDGFSIYCTDLGFYRDSIAWAGYQGSLGNGFFPMNLQVSLSPSNQLLSLQVYPNPVQEQLFFSLPEGRIIDRIQIFDLQGRLLICERKKPLVSLHTLSRGYYAYRVESGGQFASGRICKQ